MKTNPHLTDALAIFTALGWHHASLEQALTLPLGSPEQQATALAGLRSGDWGSFGKLGPHRYGYRSLVTVDETMLLLFAIRVGISAKRIIELVRLGYSEVLLPVIESRGEQFVSSFITESIKKNRWANQYAVELVLRNNLPVPHNAFYLDSWAAFAEAGLSNHATADQPPPIASLVQRSFREHLLLATELATVSLTPLVAYGLAQDLISKEEAREIAFSQIMSAQRPGDRKAWVTFIFTALQPTDQQLLSAADAFAQLIATGEAAMVEEFAIRLIPLTAGQQLADIALSGLYAKTQKAIKSVLRALQTIPHPDPAVSHALGPRLAELSTSHDKQTAQLSTTLLRDWDIAVAAPAAVSLPSDLWQQPPVVWQLPAFELGEVTADAVSAALAAIAHRDLVCDLKLERFLALACEFAQRDTVACERVLGGSPKVFHGMLADWADGSIKPWSSLARRNENLHSARLKAIITHLGTIPCLLSQPSYADLSITAEDFNARVARYSEESAYVLEPDLVLALARINPAELPRLRGANVPIELDDGTRLNRSVAKVVQDYLASPFKEPQCVNHRGVIKPERFSYPPSLRGFPPRLRVSTWESDVDFTIFPHFGNAAYRGLAWQKFVSDSTGALALQAAYSAKPLPPAAAMNLLALLRPKNKGNEECAEAVRLAWRNGVLRPGVADYAFADWQEEPTFVAQLVAQLVDVANEGLLAVAWPLFDAIIQRSVAGGKLVAGTAEAALAMKEFAAVVATSAPDTAWQTPGLRALAARKGATKAVTIAKEAVALLPEVPAAFEEPATSGSQNDGAKDFAKLWKPATGTQPVADTATIAVTTADNGQKATQIQITVTLANQQFTVFKQRGWTYDLAHEYQCEATDAQNREVYLHLDEPEQKVVSSPVRNWRGGTTGPLEGNRTALCQLLVTIVIAHLSDGKYAASYRAVVQDYSNQGVLTPASVSTAMRQLLPFPAFSPAKALYGVEKNPTMLPWLWPMLTESLGYAALQVSSDQPVPRWLNKVLDVIKHHAPLLVSATDHGIIPRRSWAGLTVLSTMKKSAATAKAMELDKLFNS